MVKIKKLLAVSAAAMVLLAMQITTFASEDNLTVEEDTTAAESVAEETTEEAPAAEEAPEMEPINEATPVNPETGGAPIALAGVAGALVVVGAAAVALKKKNA